MKTAKAGGPTADPRLGSRKFYITFGQAHSHVFNSKTIDRNTVVEIDADNVWGADSWARAIFGAKYANIYSEKPDMSYYPNGIVKGT